MARETKKRNEKRFFTGNPRLRAPDVLLDHTPEETIEIIKCMNDFVYFCENYIKIVDQDSSQVIPFNLYPYQTKLAETYKKNKRVVLLAPRQSGKSVFTIAYLLWSALFSDYKNIVLVANKEATAKKTLRKLKEMYMLLPFFLKQGLFEWNKKQISFENGSNIYAESTSSSGNRGDTVSILFIDEAGIIEKGLWEDFYTSIYPTVAAVKSAQIIITSTPKGYNHFYQIWNMAMNNQSDYTPFRVLWNEIPGRNEAYKKKTIAEFGGGAKGLRKWRQEYECFFVGSGGTLIEGDVLERLKPSLIVESRFDDKFLIYEYPEENASYISISDVAEGVGCDYSTTHVFKIKKDNKFEQVAVYRDNKVKTNEFNIVINQMGVYYNNALVIAESNSYGREILNRLAYEDEYENLFFDADNKKDFGLFMSKQTKKIGNSFMKSNIESDKFILHDFETISELSKYIKKADTYKADSGQHDDLVTPLVLLSYFLSKRELVENWIDEDFSKMKSKLTEQIESELLPMGFMCDGSSDIDLNNVGNNIFDDFE